ncbi:MAG TPA: TIGR01777 family oxidoreductase [Thermoanaerobaculia bacterium]|nr:TIGR01777 family oxidoreductase [Thermoanaerobaculia bacterium]
MNVAVSGGTGFIGSAVVERLRERGDDVRVLTRGEVAVADVNINLAGENIGRRWTRDRKRRILDSRVDTTNKIVVARPRVLINASAVGFYGARGDEILDESAASGSGFLAEVTRQWEAAAHRADDFARVVVFRFGVVLARGGGALPQMMLPFRFGAGGPTGSGQQWISWIDRQDVVRAIEWPVDNPDVRGTYNITSPEPVRNRHFAHALGRAMHRPSFMPAPAFALRLVLGEMADEMLLTGQRVVPSRALREGFTFRYPTLESSLAANFAK